MASSISVANIDATYPVAGQDNDSQGFRDNFSQIKTQLTTAGSEITSLQANTAATNATSSFNGHDVGQANLVDWSQKLNALGSVSGGITVNFNTANVISLTTSGNITGWTFSNWPKEDDASTNAYTQATIILTKGDGAHTIDLTGIKVPYSMGDGADDSTTYTFPTRVSTFVFKFFSVDGGSNIYMTNPEEYDASS